jgi:hypothetical protein
MLIDVAESLSRGEIMTGALAVVVPVFHVRTGLSAGCRDLFPPARRRSGTYVAMCGCPQVDPSLEDAVCSIEPVLGTACVAGSCGFSKEQPSRTKPLPLTSKRSPRGRQVIYVPVKGTDERQHVVNILRHHGGYQILHFRRWAVEEMRG